MEQMLEQFFISVLNMSLTAGVAILAVFAARLRSFLNSAPVFAKNPPIFAKFPPFFAARIDKPALPFI